MLNSPVNAGFGELDLGEAVARLTSPKHDFRLAHEAAELGPRVALVSPGFLEDPWGIFGGHFGQLSPRSPDLLLVGMGAVTELTSESARSLGRLLGTRLETRSRLEAIAIDLSPLSDGTLPAALISAFLSGLRRSTDLTCRFTIHINPATAFDELELDRSIATGDAQWFSAALTDTPSNLLTPGVMAELSLQVALALGLSCVVRNEDRLIAEGFGAILAIGEGSANRPCLVEIGSTKPDAVVFVGKGVTFDSGGLSLKGPTGMQGMRYDMAGAAAALAAVAALARCGNSDGVRAVFPLVENLPGPGAVKPGDVVRAYDGTRIQVMDTDFEGRVVLSDALALAGASQPRAIVSVATLTHQATVALGAEVAAVLSRDAALGRQLLAVAVRAGDPMWPLPWGERYRSQVRLSPTTVRNHPMVDEGRAITAALFLGEFVPGHIAFAHIDLGGSVWAGDASTGSATGTAVATLIELARELTAKIQ